MSFFHFNFSTEPVFFFKFRTWGQVLFAEYKFTETVTNILRVVQFCDSTQLTGSGSDSMDEFMAK